MSKATSAIPTLDPSHSFTELLRRGLDQGYELRLAAALGVLEKGTASTISEIESLGHLEKLASIHTHYMEFFQRLADEDGVVLIDSVASEPFDNPRKTLQVCTTVVTERLAVTAEKTKEIWKDRVAARLREKMSRADDTDLNRALTQHEEALTNAIATSRPWILIGLLKRLREDLDDRVTQDLSQQAARASLRMAELTQQTTAITRMGALFAALALVAYAAQAFYARQQVQIAQRQLDAATHAATSTCPPSSAGGASGALDQTDGRASEPGSASSTAK